VRLTAAELGSEVVDRRGLDLDARHPPDHAAAEFAQARGQERTVEEPLWLLVVVGRPAIPNVVEVDRELRSVKGPPVAEILSGSDDLVPGLKRQAAIRPARTLYSFPTCVYWEHVTR
jgi:hypothetical protein